MRSVESTPTIFAGGPAETPMNSPFWGLRGGWWRAGSMGQSAEPKIDGGVVFIMFDAGLACFNKFLSTKPQLCNSPNEYDVCLYAVAVVFCVFVFEF